MKLSDTISRKFIESYPVKNRTVLTHNGYKPIKTINKTILYEVWEITLENGLQLKCADNHIVITENFIEVFAKDSLGSILNTIHGPSKVISVKNLSTEEHMYDIEVDSDDNLYYSNGILSHNTLCTRIYILWCVLFGEDINYGIAANKQGQAKEVLDGIKMAYMNLPLWMQQGVKSWNEFSIKLANGGIIKISATSASAFRGMSFAASKLYQRRDGSEYRISSGIYVDECVEYDTYITVRNKKTNEIQRIKIGEFYVTMKQQINDYEVLTHNGFKDFKGVKETIRNDNIKITFSDNSDIIVTPEHRIKVSKSIFRRARNLKIKHKVNGLKIVDIERNVQCSNKFYDLLDVVDGNHYITNSVTSHNCAFIDKRLWEAFRNSVIPTVSSGKYGGIIYTSTPCGMNHFHKIWLEAEQGRNGFFPRFVPYWEHPLRDEEWAKNAREELGSDVAFAQEYSCSFSGSSWTLITGQKLSNLVYKTPLREDRYGTKIYEEPKEGNYYVLGVDTAKYGEGDYLSMKVVNVTNKPFKEVASFRQKDITYLNLLEPMNALGKLYNNAQMFIENNSGDGQSAADLLQENYDYENIYAEKAGILGFRTTNKSRRIGLQNLKQLIEDDMLEINDKETIEELQRFALKNGKYQAVDGYSDDAVLALVASIYFLQLRSWVDSEDLFKFFNREEAIEEDDSFIFGFVSDASGNIIPF